MFRQIILFLLFCSLLTAEESEQFCQINPIKYSAFNYGDFLIIVTHLKANVTKFWAYMTADKELINIKNVPDPTIFQEISNNDIKVVISFDFSDNCPTPEFCTAIEKARKLVLIQFKSKFGTPTSISRHPFAALVHKEDNFTRIQNKSNMPWNWSPSGGDISKENIFPKIDKNWGYYGGVFSHKHNTMIVTSHNLQNDKEFRVKTRKLNQRGKWEEWKEKLKIGFRGLFILNNILFGITPFDKSIVEFKQDMTFTSKGPLKRFFNCNETSDPLITEPNTDLQNETTTESPIDTSSPKNETKDQILTTPIPPILSTNSSSNTTDEIKDNSESKSGSSLGFVILWVLLVVIFVLIVGLILFFLVFKREPKKPIYALKKKDQK